MTRTMKSVMDALEHVTGGPVLSSNQCHDLAVALNKGQPASVMIQALREAYQEGYSDGQNNPNGYSSNADRDKCADDLYAEITKS